MSASFARPIKRDGQGVSHKNGWKEIGRDFLSGKGDTWQETRDLTVYSKFTRITRLKLVYNLRKT